jgi:hypothetical protein
MKALLVLLTLACASLGGWAAWEHYHRTRLEDELAASRVERDKLSRRAMLAGGMRSGVVISEDGPTGLSEKAKELGIKLEDEEDEKEAAGRKKNAPGEKSTDLEAPDMAKLLRDPAMREAIRAQTQAYLEFEYAGLFDLMGLDETKQDAVLKILKDRTDKQTDLGLKAVDPKTSPADRETAAADYAKFTAESEANLKELLGDNYSKFERFEKSEPEREQLKTLNSMLKEQNLALDETTETKLMDAMYNTRREFRFDNDLSDTATVAPNDLSAETVDRYVQQNEELQQQIQAKAKEILTPEQFEVFIKSQTNRQQVEQLGIQMLRQMTGNQKPADARN